MQRPREDDVEGSPPPKRSKGGSKGGKSGRSKGGDGKDRGSGGSKGGLGNMRRCAFKVLCTDPFAANLIGKAGATRAAIEDEAQCALWISKRDELFPKPSLRLLILHADEPQQVLSGLEKLVPKLVEVAERDREAGETDSPLIGKAEGEYVFHVAVPTLIRGKLLGRGGANIQELREKTGAKIFVENEAYDGHQSARIIGNPEIINYVLSLLNDMVQEEAGSDDFAQWASMRTFTGEFTKGPGKGDRGDRQESRGKGGKGGDQDRDRRSDRGDKGGRRERDHQSHHRDRSPDMERSARSHSGRDMGPPFPEVGGPPLDAMGHLSHEFPEGATELDHAISCELARTDVDGLLGAHNEHLPFLQKQTGTAIEMSENDSFCKIVITGPLLNTYLAHFVLMKKLHDNMAPPPMQQAESDKVEDLKAQLAALQGQLQAVQRGGGSAGRPGGGRR